MVLADSVEPLHYPAIMFSLPLAPQAPSPTIIPLLPPYSLTHTHTRTHLHPQSFFFCPFCIHPSSPHLVISPPVLPFIPVDSSSGSLHVFFIVSVFLLLSLCILLFSLSSFLTPFHWNYYFFTFSCFPLLSFLPSFINLLWFIGLTAVTFWKKLVCQNQLCKKYLIILCIHILSSAWPQSAEGTEMIRLGYLGRV